MADDYWRILEITEDTATESGRLVSFRYRHVRRRPWPLGDLVRTGAARVYASAPRVYLFDDGAQLAIGCSYSLDRALEFRDAERKEHLGEVCPQCKQRTVYR